MSDDRPASAATEPEAPEVGRCLKCKRMVELRATFDLEGKRLHREGHYAENGSQPKKLANVCGPVVVRWIYHMAYWWEAGPQFGIRRDACAFPEPLESNAGQVVLYEQRVASDMRLTDHQTGAPLVGLKPVVQVISWQPLGWE